MCQSNDNQPNNQPNNQLFEQELTNEQFNQVPGDNNIDPELNDAQIQEAWNTTGSNWQITRSDTFTDNQISKIHNEVCRTLNLEYHYQASLVLAMFCQSGGCARQCSGNLNIFLYNQTIYLKQMRKIFTDMKEKHGMRKYARTQAKTIGRLCSIRNIPGNLAKKIQRNNPEESFTDKERVLLSDFQIDNEDLSIRLKKLILASFKIKSTYKKQ